LSFTYDALGRKLTESGPQGSATSEYDLAGRRTKLTYPGTGLFVNTDYLVTGEVTAIRENGASSGVGLLASYEYDPATSAGQLGLRTKVTFGSGAKQAYTYDPMSRLASLTNDLSGVTNDLTVNITGYNPASQITGTSRSNDAYAWTAHSNGSSAYTQNGLNQQTVINGSTVGWTDQRGNLTTDPTSGKAYSYWPSSDQLWTSSPPWAALSYDGLARLAIIDTTTVDTRFAYDGMDTIADYDGSNVLQHRYVFGPGIDEPIVQYDGSGTSSRRFLSSDERGSIIAASDNSGTLQNIDTYDEYGRPGATNSGRFQYAGQRWISEIGAYDYKTRDYLPHLGIFGQTDRIGYGDGPNLYAYVKDDAVNLTDPLGTQCTALTWYHDVYTNGVFNDGRSFHIPLGIYCAADTISLLSQGIDPSAGALAGLFILTAGATNQCLSHVRAFVDAHGHDAAILANILGEHVTAAEVLAVAAEETRYGLGGFAPNGNFFGLHGVGTYPMGTYYTKDNHTPTLTFPQGNQFMYSGLIFVNREGRYLTPNVGDNPYQFFSILNRHGYATGDSTYPSRMTSTGPKRGPYTLVKACTGGR